MVSFVDTNILVYAEDVDAGERHDIARDLVVELWNTGDGVVSIQVLQELFVTITRKLPRPMTARQASEIVRQYLTWTVVDNTGSLLLDGIALQQKAKLSFWDALIVQASISSGCERLYSEDLNAGQRFEQVEVINPFTAKTT